MKYSCFALMLFFALSATRSDAAAFITIEESGSDVIATLSGSIDNWTGSTQTTGLTSASNRIRPAFDSGIGQPAFFAATDPNLGSPVNNYYYTASTIPSDFGTNSTNFAANSSTASTMLFVRATSANPIYIAQSYVLGTAITGVLTFQNQSFQTMGLTEGSYVWSWGDPSTPGNGDSITLSVVPEPATLGTVLIAAVTFVGCRVRRRRGRQKPGADAA